MTGSYQRRLELMRNNHGFLVSSGALPNTLKHGFTKIRVFFENSRVHETIRHVFFNGFRTSNKIVLDGDSDHSSDHRIRPVIQITRIAKIKKFQDSPRSASKSGLQGIRETRGARMTTYANSGRFQIWGRIN